MNIIKRHFLKLSFLIIVFFVSHYAFSQTSKSKSKPTAPKYSEERALELISDYYSFYNADESYSDPVVRRVSNNVFYVSVKYCSGGEKICYKKEYNSLTGLYSIKKNDFFWNSKVLVLTITSKTKYTVKVKEQY